MNGILKEHFFTGCGKTQASYQPSTGFGEPRGMKLWVPHTCDVFAFVAWVGKHDPQIILSFVSLVILSLLRVWLRPCRERHINSGL
jgi:hypothetical protein